MRYFRPHTRYALAAGAAALIAVNLIQVGSVHGQGFGLPNIGKAFKGLPKALSGGKGRRGKGGGGGDALVGGIVAGAVGGLILNQVTGGKLGLGPSIALGAVLAGASPAFQKEMAHRFNNDWRWSGFPRGGKRRVVIVPGRAVSKAEQDEATKQAKLDTMRMQQALQALKYYNGRIDGSVGGKTNKAIKAFQQANGDDPSGTLSAEQRALLIRQASLAGMPELEQSMPVEDAVVDGASGDVQLVKAIASDAKPADLGRSYKLARRQFDKFASDILKKGELSTVTAAKLGKDGTIEISTKEDEDGITVKRRLIGDVGNLYVTRHEYSEQFGVVIFYDPNSGDSYPLNTFDQFNDKTATDSWIGDTRETIGTLAKLTDRTPPAAEIPDNPPGTQIAGIRPEDLPKNAGGQDQGSQAGQAAGSDDAQSGRTPVVAPVKSAENSCRNNVYVSFKFPKDEDPISHYNITPPENVLMMDNGDSTAYLTGKCVTGSYNYKYVYVTHSDDKKTWKSNVREGSFQIASNSSNCQVSLNGHSDTPVKCF